jgi:hypothetical protein
MVNIRNRLGVLSLEEELFFFWFNEEAYTAEKRDICLYDFIPMYSGELHNCRLLEKGSAP